MQTLESKGNSSPLTSPKLKACLARKRNCTHRASPPNSKARKVSLNIAAQASWRERRRSLQAESAFSSHGFVVTKLLTSDSSGIGRAISIFYAREGADVSIVFLPEEKEDAEDTKKAVEKESRKCLLIPGDLMDNKTCEEAVKKHVDELVHQWTFDSPSKLIKPFKVRRNRHPCQQCL